MPGGSKTPRGGKKSNNSNKETESQKSQPSNKDTAEFPGTPRKSPQSPSMSYSFGSSSTGSLTPRTPSSERPVAAAEPEKKKGFSEFFNRVVFTLIMAYGFLGLVSQGANVLLPTVLLIQIMMFKEVLRINQKERKYRQMPYFKYLPWYFLTVTVVVLTSFHWKDVVLATYATTYPILTAYYQSLGIIAFGAYCLGFVIFVMTFRKGLYRYQVGQLTWISMTIIFIMGQGSFQGANLVKGVYWFLLPISCVVHNDIWAYAWGKSFGRTKLLKLSPKKTMEGFVGAWLFTTIWAFWFSGFMTSFPELYCQKKDLFGQMTCEKQDYFVKHATPLPEGLVGISMGFLPPTVMIARVQWHSISFAAFASLIAPFGGFFASGLKRAFKLKDFGDLIPGHGGMTDRMDCQIITGMFTYVYTSSFIFAGARCPSMIEMLNCALQLPVVAQRQLAEEILANVNKQ